MDILVLLKQVPVSTDIRMDENHNLIREGAALEMNIADASALELGLRLGTVTALSMGRPGCHAMLRDALARGADRGVLVTDPALGGADALATARALAAAVGALARPYDLILCGRRAIDGETGQVGPELAALLGLPVITNVSALALQGNALTLTRSVEAGIETLAAPLPCLVTLQEYTYPLRLPGILGLRRAKALPIEVLTAAQLDLPPQQLGLRGSPTRVKSVSTQAAGLRQTCWAPSVEAGCAHLRALWEVTP